ncbi:unnamed protein product [Leptidea sinapis]|uniref:Uncharacterized protein n=1 Tax=Leptidea sinapis TaxID=189913 RepID=A0A5E4Q741_9NEOP|nr:unnamed protein product [Leptidea sinapis]
MGDGNTRYNRRPTTTKADDVQPTLRPRGARRREETDSSTRVPESKTQVRTRGRSRFSENDSAAISTETTVQPYRNQQSQSRRLQSRIKSRFVDTEASLEKPMNRQNIIRSRQNSRRNLIQSSTTAATSVYMDEGRSSTLSYNGNKIESTNQIRRRGPTEQTLVTQTTREENSLGNVTDTSKDTVVDDVVIANQFRRSSTQSTMEKIPTIRTRGNIKTRTKPIDLAASGTINTMTTSIREETTIKTVDVRNSRRLRYKSRPSQTDTNLTGEGLVTSKIMQKIDSSTNQNEKKPTNFTIPNNDVKDATDKSVLSNSPKRHIVVKRPHKSNGEHHTAVVTKTKISEEISEDDNYPESFKALLQAKNATHISSPSGESLSVKASQKVSKTHPTPIQQFQTGPDKDNVSRLRKKLKKDQNNESVLDKQIDLPVSTNYSSSESPKTKSFDYKPRGTYLPRNKSQRVNNLRLESSSTFRPASEGPYKFSRKFKASTTPTPNTDAILKTKRVESNSEPKKPVVRSSLYTRKNNPFKESTKEPVHRKNDRVQSESFFKPRGATLPRTSYYSKQYLQRNISLSPESTSLNDVLNDSNSKIADKKSDDSPEFPLIFTSSNNSDENLIVNTKKVDNGYSMNNKETYDNNTERSNVNSVEESEKNLATDVTTQKYHANYKAKLDSSYIDKNTSVTTPTITNFRTKNYGRKSANFQEKQQTINNLKERNQRKIGGKISKTTEVPENSIAPEPEKPKNKFSSKYRASNIDRPFYKPTVPTVTPSTAWLKFFVTDHQQLTKTDEQSLWFGDEFFDVTTEFTPRTNTTSSSTYYESSLELVEGEEIQLGPDMNAIAFTRTRGQLSSADLRLSESLAKPLQVLNVEASNHSPSVTVSIFDALAEILTSTPKPRLSSTTEVLPKQNVDESVNVSLDGVSSNINVNTDTGLATKDTMNAQDIVSTSAINVQTTEAIKSNVFNSLLVGENVTPPIKEENQNTFSTSSHPTTFPTPTTPLSARKPFAIRVLYSDTVTPKYDMTTAATTTNSKSTDNATMVYNTVSDLLLSNNKLVSTELTSMLTNNIKSIIDSLDEESKSRLSVDMTKILNSMIPEASRKIPTTVSTLIPDTTPYSMEDINDTANINIDDDDDDKSYNGISQVSSTLQDVENINSVNSRTTENPLHVYSSQASETAHKSEHEDTTTTMYNIDIIPFPKSQNDFRTNGSPTENMSFDSNSNNFDKQVLSPLFTPNIKINKLYESNNAQNNLDKVSDIELWILSKKARVLKMIEDILREHNDEISNPPLQSFNISDISFSSRLSEIMTTMNQKTRNTDLPDSITTKQDITPITPNSPSTLFTSSNVIQEISSMTSTELMAPDPKLVPTTESIIEMSSQTGTASTNTQSVETSTQYNESNDNLLATTESFIDDIKMPESVSGINFRNFIMDSSTTENDSVSISTTGSPFDSMKIEENIATESDLNNNIVDDGTTTQIIFNEVFSITTAASPIETIKMLENVTTETDSNNYSSSTTQMTINDDIYITTTVPQINNLKLDENVTERDVENITEHFFTPEVITNPDSVEDATTENILVDSSFMSTTTENDLEALQKSGIKSTTTFVSQVNSSNELVTVSNQIKMSPQSSIPRKDYFIFGILPNNTVVRKDPNDNLLETLTEASPYIIYGVLPNNTIIRRFPNGTRVPQIMQKIDVLPISPWSLRNPYSPIHNIPAIVRPQSNPIQDSSNTVSIIDTSYNEKGTSLTADTVNNLESMIPSSALNIKDSRLIDITTSTQPPAEKSTASHVLSLRTSTMLPSIDEILLNSISLATKEENVISSMTSSTPEPRILTLDIDPETKQIRTEKPKDANGNTIFKFIPIEDVTVTPQDSNVLKLASPKNSKATDKNNQITTVSATTKLHTQTPQVQNNLNNNIEVSTSLVEDAVGTPLETTSESISERPQIIITTVNTDATTENQKYSTVIQTVPSTISVPDTTTESFTAKTTTLISTTDLASVSSIQEIVELPTNPSTSPIPSISETPTALPISTSDPQNTPFALQTERIPKKIPGFDNNKYVNAQVEENAKLLQALLLATSDENQSSKKKIKVGMKEESTTSRSLEEELKQFEEDTKLLKALLQATGRSPDSLKIPSLNDIKAIVTTTPSERPTTQQTTTTQRILSTIQTTTQSKIQATITTPSSIDNDIKKLQEDTLLLQALLKAAGTKNEQNIPIISGLTSNVRMSSKILNSSTKSIPTTPLNIRPVYTTTPSSMSTSMKSQAITVSTLQPSTEDIRISTTYQPVTTKNIASPLTTTIRPDTTTEIPSSSTFSDEEDLQFLQNLKSVLSTNNNNMDPETALANRVIALAVERSLSDIQVGKNAEPTKVITSTTPTTTIRTTTTRITTTTSRPNIPSIEEDIKQFEQDTKLLQALLKATGQDPSKLNLPTLPILNTPALEKINPNNRGTATTTVKPFGAQIAVKDELRNESDDAKLLQTLKQLQDVQETTTTRSKLAITGQTSDEALKKLINKGQNPGMVSEATKSSASLSTEYGNTNDALLAALLKEQGFGPTTASSLDEQLRLAALLNQVVVTPKVRRTTTLPPPPPAPRRPILDGLAWLWQQWRETGPGSAPPRPSRPAPSDKPQTPSTATSSRVNWFGSGPFVGNADERPASNRVGFSSLLLRLCDYG